MADDSSAADSRPAADSGVTAPIGEEEGRAAQAGDEPVLDWQGAMRRFHLSPEALVRIAEPFLHDCPDLLQQMREGIASGDSNKLQRAAHSLKGAADVFSAHRVVQLSFELEMKGREKKLEGAEQTWQELDRQARLLLAAIEDAMRDVST